MTSKRPHTKSRLGCRQCKSRKIRCGQTAPCCINCAKRGLECEYQEWAQLLTPGGFGNATLQSTTSSRSPESSTTTEGLHLDDLGLLHHFTLYTSQTLGALESERYRHIWQHEVPKLALSHPPLMHALLAFAAAHQASIDEKAPAARSQMHLARSHYSQALVLFRSSVKELTAERADVLLCYCNLIGFLTLFLEFDKPIDEQDPIGDFASLLGILHSSVGVLEAIEEPMRKCIIGELLQHKWERRTHNVAPEVAASLDKLDVLVEQHRGQSGFEVNAIDGLSDAILKLRGMFELAEPRPQSWVYLLSWPIDLGSEFSRFVQQRHPVALCALCHWLVPAHHAPVKWHVGDWPKRVMLAVSKELGSGGTWDSCLAWPRSEILE